MTKQAKQVKQLDRVIIRFAGDSGDGMQLTGDRFTQETASFGNDLSTLPELPRRDPRARRARCPASRRSRCTSPTTTSSPPGDAPDVLVAMNPAALKANLADLRQGRDDHRRHPRLHHPQPDQGRLRRATRSRTARSTSTTCTRFDADRHDRRGGQGVRPVPQGRRPREEHVRARPAVVDVRPAHRVDDRVPRAAVRQGPRHPRRERRRVQGRLELRRDRPRRSSCSTRSSPRRCAPAPTATSPATWRWPTA